MEQNNSKYCGFLLFLARLEKSLELHRQTLCEKPAFEPYCAFRILDPKCKNFINTEDLADFLTESGFSFDPKLIFRGFICRYDLDKDGVLNYSEFLRAVLPFEDPGLRTLAAQKAVIERIEDPREREDVCESLAQFLKEEIESYSALIDKKSELFPSEEDFSFSSLFHEIDTKFSNSLDFKSFMDFFRKNGVFPYDEEILAIIHRFDSNGDGLLSLEDVADFLGGSDKTREIPLVPEIDARVIEELHRATQILVKSVGLKAEEDEEKRDLIEKLRENPKKGVVSGLRNTIQPERTAVLSQNLEKKNKSIANSTEIEKIKEDPKLKELIEGREGQRRFGKEIAERFEERMRGVSVPGDLKVEDPESARDLVGFFLRVAVSEEKVEEIKTSLFVQTDFNIIDFFGFIDKSKRGFCTYAEFREFLVEAGCGDLEEEVITLLIWRLDPKKRQKIRYVDFEKFMTSQGLREPDRKPLNIRGFNFSYSELFSLQTRKLITRFVTLAGVAEAEIENSRPRVNERRDLEGNLRAFFEEVDQDSDGFISEGEGFLVKLGEFFRRIRFEANFNEIQRVLRYFDNDRDGRISFEEYKTQLAVKLSGTKAPKKNEKTEEKPEKTEEKPEKIEEKSEKSEENPEKIEENPEKIEEKSEKIEENPEKIEEKSEKIEAKSQKIDEKRKTIKKESLKSQRQMIVFDDPEESSKLSFLEYKRDKVGPSQSQSPEVRLLNGKDEIKEKGEEITKKHEENEGNNEQESDHDEEEAKIVKTEENPEPKEDKSEKNEVDSDKNEKNSDKNEKNSEENEKNSEENEKNSEENEEKSEENDEKAEKTEEKVEKTEEKAEKTEEKAEKTEENADKSVKNRVSVGKKEENSDEPERLEKSKKSRL